MNKEAEAGDVELLNKESEAGGVESSNKESFERLWSWAR